MKSITAYLLGLAISAAPVQAFQVEGNTITLDDREVQACIDGGGCQMVTKAALAAALRQAIEAGRQSCGVRSI